MKTYKLVQSTLDGSYKIIVTTKLFGVTVWNSFYKEPYEEISSEMRWHDRARAQAYLKELIAARPLQRVIEKFIDVKVDI